MGVVATEWKEKYGDVVPFGALFGEDELMITDPAALTHIFHTRSYEFLKPDEVRGRLGRTLGEGLFFTEGDIHRRQRRIMNPGFTNATAKNSFPTFLEVGYKLRDVLKEAVDNQTIEVNSFATPEEEARYKSARGSSSEAVLNVTNWLALATLQVIGLCGFNYDFEAFEKKQNPLADAFKTIAGSAGSKITPQLVAAQQLIHWVLQNVPFAGRLPIKRIRDVKALLNVLDRECGRIYEEQKREVLLESKNGDLGKDAISLLIKANLSEGKGAMADSEVRGQMSTFVLAGGESSSTLLTWILYELAREPGQASQKRLREEIAQARQAALKEGRSELSADELDALPFLAAVVKEGYRFDAPAAKMHRLSPNDTIVPLTTPITLTNGRTITELAIKAGTAIYIPVLVYNRSKAIFGEDADRFVPDRWLRSDGVGAGVTGAVAGTLTFSTGPRICIGYRFAVLETKTILALLVESFEFSERDEGGTPIERGSALISRPFIPGEEALGNRLPLRIKTVGA